MSTGAHAQRHHAPTTGLRVDLEFAGLKSVLALIRSLPRDRARKIVGGVVSRGGMLSSRLREVGLDNLEKAFPEKDRTWCEETLRASFRQLGYMAAELAHFEDLTPTNIWDIVGFDSPDSEAVLRERSADRRAIIATGHFGNWELLAQAAGLMGMPVHLVHRPLKNARVDDLLTEVRALAGTKIIYKHAAARDLLRVLHRGDLVAIPIDQHAPGATGIPVPFFGRLAKTNPGPARLAQIAQVPIQLVLLARTGDSGRHQVVTRPRIDPPPRGKDPAVLVEVTARLNEQFESVVREYPEQWLWMHRRWRVST